mmetsp:Transcript_132619/g.283384  ORF Transcript_132619/g.283384 Transcript_132619/m.283384 type:complete len:225 (-) Transcript_132619:172-846(-)
MATPTWPSRQATWSLVRRLESMAFGSKGFCEKTVNTSMQDMKVSPLSFFSLQKPRSFTMMRFHSAPLMTRGSGGVVYRNHSNANSDRFSSGPREVGSFVKWLWWRYSVWSSLHCPSSWGISSMWLSPKVRLRNCAISPMAFGRLLRRFWLNERVLSSGNRQTSAGSSRRRFWSARRSSSARMAEISGMSSSRAFFRMSNTLTCVKARYTCAGMAEILLSFRSST